MSVSYGLRFEEVSIDEEIEGLHMEGLVGFIEYESMRAFDVVNDNFVSFKVFNGEHVIVDSIISTHDVDELSEYITRRVEEAYLDYSLDDSESYLFSIVICSG